VDIEDSVSNHTIKVGVLSRGETGQASVAKKIDRTTTNLVTAIGADMCTATDWSVSDSDSVVVIAEGLVLNLTVDVNPQTAYPGELVTFNYTVENAGTVALDVEVGDNWSTFTHGNLGPGDTVSWSVPYRVYATMTNVVTAVGSDGLGHTVSEQASVTVVVLDQLDPIEIDNPLYEGSTVVTGTAHAGREVGIRDLMSDTFPSLNVVVQLDGTFEFAGLPPLVAGHVIVVQGYNEWDSAVVGPVSGGDPYLTLSPQCGGTLSGTLILPDTITVEGHNWDPSSEVEIYWDDVYDGSPVADANGDFSYDMVQIVTEGMHTVSGRGALGAFPL